MGAITILLVRNNIPILIIQATVGRKYSREEALSIQRQLHLRLHSRHSGNRHRGEEYNLIMPPDMLLRVKTDLQVIIPWR
jgi:hypothetical protein